jgi:G3E family GTPase
MTTPPFSLPVTLLTGFLGSGKTTLLNTLLRAQPLTAVVMNEFGAVALDHQLLEEQRGPLALLSGGCVCCQIQGTLAPTLKNLWMERASGHLPPFERLIIETTGIADPAPIIDTLVSERWIAARHRLDAVITLVDAQLGAGQLAAHFEAERQVAAADRLLLTKTDLASPAQAEATRHRLRQLNPGAPHIVVTDGQIASDAILNLDAWRPQAQPEQLLRWLAVPHFASVTSSRLVAPTAPSSANAAHGERIRSFSLVFDAPLDETALGAALNMLRNFRAENLLRMKAIVNLRGHERPVVLHGVQHVFYPPAELAAWPDADRRSRFVFITADLDAEFVARLLDDFTTACAVEFADPAQSVTN